MTDSPHRVAPTCRRWRPCGIDPARGGAGADVALGLAAGAGGQFGRTRTGQAAAAAPAMSTAFVPPKAKEFDITTLSPTSLRAPEAT